MVAKERTPESFLVCRVFPFWKRTPEKKKRREEIIPWLKITNIVASVPIFNPLNNTTNRMFIWPMEEYAIALLISDCIAINPTPPTVPRALRKSKYGALKRNLLNIRTKPKAPSFRRTLAKTILPPVGASTWAFGSHKWIRNKGSFTPKPTNKIKSRPGEGVLKRGERIKLVLIVLHTHSTLTRNGIEKVIVKNKRNFAACRRSNWYPHPKISSKIGIRIASNEKRRRIRLLARKNRVDKANNEAMLM
jgi:hypothetical protein